MKAPIRFQDVLYGLLWNAGISTVAMGQGVPQAASAASAPIYLRAPPGYEIELVALFAFLALLGLLATLASLASSRRDKRLEAQVDELIRANARRVDLHEADQTSRRQ